MNFGTVNTDSIVQNELKWLWNGHINSVTAWTINSLLSSEALKLSFSSEKTRFYVRVIRENGPRRWTISNSDQAIKQNKMPFP